MICKKVSKVRNKTKSSSLKAQKSKSLAKSRKQSSSQSSQSSPPKSSKTRPKQNKNCNNKKNNDKYNKKSEKTKQSINKSEDKAKKSRFSAKKEVKSNNNIINNHNKSCKLKKIKEICKKVKTKTSDKIENLVKKTIKRNLRNNTKIKYESNVSKDNKINKMKESPDSNKNKNLRQNFDTKSLNSKNNEKLSLRSVSQNSFKFNLCSKLFPTLDSNKSVIDNKTTDKSDSKTKNLRNQLKSESNRKKEEMEKIESKTREKTKEKIKSNEKKKSLRNSSESRNKKVGNDKPAKSQSKRNSRSVSSMKAKSKNNKSPPKDNLQKNGLSLGRRGHRLAGLNAIAKVRLLCENESEKNESIDRYNDRLNDNKEKTEKKVKTKSEPKCVKSEPKSKKIVNNCRALVPVDNSRKAVAVRKRKLVDDSVEIIDTRSCKRMASLNASAIMAASYLPEKIKRSKSVESNHSNNSVEMVREMQTFSQTVSRYEISPPVNTINGIHMNQVFDQNSLILSAHKHETIETVKQLKVSNKIKDRLLGIAKFERQERAKQKRLEKKNRNSSHGVGQQSMISSPEMSGFQATKVQVTKVTHINTSQGVNKDKKSGHQIESILETDSSVVHKYQVQTKSTIQMQTTFNSNNGSTIANVTTLTAPQTTAITGPAPRMQILTEPQVMATSGAAQQPTYFNIGAPTPAVVQLHNNYQTLGPSTSALNPMPIINLSEPYPPHYSSAFSVPHFATHSHPTQNPFTYFNPGLYQPAGPLLQGFPDPCLIHKPIPFHPSTPQVNHIHTSPQFSNSTQSGQTFGPDLSQAFAAGPQMPQFYPQMQTPIRAPQTVFFQAVPQTNGTAYTLLNPGVHYSHPTLISSDQFVTNRENPILSNETTFINMNKIINENNIINNHMNTNPSVAQTTNDTTQRNVSKSSQCSPQNRDHSKGRPETYSCDSSNSSVRVVGDKHNVIPIETQKKTNKSDNKSHKKKKSLLLNPICDRKTEEVIHRNSSSQTLSSKYSVSESGDKIAKNPITSLSCQTAKTNSILKTNHKNMKTVCLQVSPSLPSVPVPSPQSVSQTGRHLPLRKSNKKRFSHGWSWEGSAQHKYVYLNNEEQSYLRKCYPAIRHNEGDVIKVRDCVLLRSGPRKTDLPFVAKIAALWESPEGEMMMSLLWYYRPEHTDLEYYSNQMNGEIFASKHRDTNSVACIDDKCYVLTYNEFCRYRRSKLAKQSMSRPSPYSSIVPVSDESYPRAERIPPPRVFPELVFCCRKVYDYRQKRILKNPNNKINLNNK